MTEFEKKQSGEIYDARDPKLRKQQNHAKNDDAHHVVDKHFLKYADT